MEVFKELKQLMPNPHTEKSVQNRDWTQEVLISSKKLFHKGKMENKLRLSVEIVFEYLLQTSP